MGKDKNKEQIHIQLKEVDQRLVVLALMYTRKEY